MYLKFNIVARFHTISTVNFGIRFNVDHVTVTPSTGSTTTIAGQRDYSLNCSSILFQPNRLPSDVPSPNFQWSFDGSTSLPSGVTAMPTVMSSSNSTSETYTSTLQFSQLSQCHIGSYRCRLGPGRLENSVMVTMNGILCTRLLADIELSFSFQGFNQSLSRSLPMELQYWDKMATPSHVMLL